MSQTCHIQARRWPPRFLLQVDLGQKRTAFAILPDDVLLEIFAAVRNLYIAGVENDCRTWLGLRRVCWRWHVVTNEPVLWSNFKASRSEAWFRFMLQQSAAIRRKDITFGHYHTLPYQLPLLQPHINSLRSLHFGRDLSMSLNPLGTKELLRAFLANTFPALEEIAVLFGEWLGACR